MQIQIVVSKSFTMQIPPIDNRNNRRNNKQIRGSKSI